MAATATQPPARIGIPSGAFNVPTVSIEPNFGNAANFQPMQNDLGPDISACGTPTSLGSFQLVDTWETGFIGRIQVEVSMMKESWSVAVLFSDPVVVGNVQVFNARFVETSADSRALLFLSKSTQGGQPLAIPNFAFVMTDMPSWSKKPRMGKVVYFDRALTNHGCISGQSGVGQTAHCPQMANQAPPVVHLAQPAAPAVVTTTMPPTTKKALSIMELLGQRKHLKTTQFTPTTRAPSSGFANGATGGGAIGGTNICANQILGSMSIGNSWYDDGSEEHTSTEDVRPCPSDVTMRR